MRRVASIDSNQIVRVVASTNVTANALVQTVGVIQRAGFHNVILASSGTDNGTNGTWQVTIDCRGWLLPGCIPSTGGFTTRSLKDLEMEIEPLDIEQRTTPRTLR
jgi:hypothetical protein